MKTTKPTTIIYVTSNVEDDKYEENIRDFLRQNRSGLPIISVSRKPIKLGKNICIGEDAPICESTTLRQILTGLLMAKTEYCILAHAYTLYPPEYFTFVPDQNDQFYHYANVWVLGGKFWQKGFSETALMCGREHWINVIQTALKGHRGWKEFTVPPLPIVAGLYTWSSENAAILLKTPHMGRRFPIVLRDSFPKHGLPFWGSAADLNAKILS